MPYVSWMGSMDVITYIPSQFWGLYGIPSVFVCLFVFFIFVEAVLHYYGKMEEYSSVQLGSEGKVLYRGRLNFCFTIADFGCIFFVLTCNFVNAYVCLSVYVRIFMYAKHECNPKKIKRKNLFHTSFAIFLLIT